jgi:hypothetical protein
VPESIGPASVPAENPASQIPKVKRKRLRLSREPNTRFQVVVCWLFFGFLLLISRTEITWFCFKVASVLALGFFVWPYFENPYRLHTRKKLPLHLNCRVIAPPEVPTSPYSQFVLSALAALGFTSAGHVVVDTEQNVVMHIEMFLHPENQDSAHIAKLMSGLATHQLVGFKSRFDDGFTFETNNHYTPNSFKPDPQYQVFRFPQVRRVADLYRLHRKLKERFLAAHRPVLADGEGEVAVFIARAELVFQRHAKTGAYKLAPSGEHYVYSWPGAIRQGWLHAWPIKRLRTARIYARANKMVRELGFRMHPKFGWLEDPNHPMVGTDRNEPRRGRL